MNIVCDYRIESSEGSKNTSLWDIHLLLRNGETHTLESVCMSQWDARRLAEGLLEVSVPTGSFYEAIDNFLGELDDPVYPVMKAPLASCFTICYNK